MPGQRGLERRAPHPKRRGAAGPALEMRSTKYSARTGTSSRRVQQGLVGDVEAVIRSSRNRPSAISRADRGRRRNGADIDPHDLRRLAAQT